VAARLGDTGPTEETPLQRTRQMLGVAAVTARVQAIRMERTAPQRTLSPSAPAERPFYQDPAKSSRETE